jgi:Asp-tRNA(Asn)/Glu-tRNA(Gln) amidotransferase A subunit family amidase
VEYIQAQRLRTGLARDFEALLQTVDVLVHRPFDGEVLAISNLTGHPSVVLPVPTEGREQPQAIALTGRLADEPFLAQLASAWQAGAGRVFPPAFAALRPAPAKEQGAAGDADPAAQE